MRNTLTCLRVLALGLTLVATGTIEARAATPTPEATCRRAIQSGLSRWLLTVSAARLRCANDVASGLLPGATDCLSGLDEPRLARVFASAGTALRSGLGGACSSADWGLLSYPGPCGGDPSTFGSESLATCIETVGGADLSRLLSKWVPRPLGRTSGPALQCIRGVPRRAAAMVFGEMKARFGCLLANEGIDPSVDCRAQPVPWGPGTSEPTVDARIQRAQMAWKAGMPRACAEAEFSRIGFAGACPGEVPSGSAILDFHSCVFDANRQEVAYLMDLAFPSTPVCGNGILQEGETCDDGTGNSDTTPNACRENCVAAFCGDGVEDSGNDEQCDDGNEVDLDGCTVACIREYCGDGIRNNGNAEECDDGNTNTADACVGECRAATCGDGLVCRGAGCTTGPAGGVEQCDDGDKNSPDGACQADCSGYATTCTVTIGVTNSVRLGSIGWELDYSKMPGKFLGAGAAVDCTSLLTDGLTSFNDLDDEGRLLESVIIGNGLSAPANLARCTFATSNAALTAGDFRFTVLDASSPDFDPVAATVAVTSLQCTTH